MSREGKILEKQNSWQEMMHPELFSGLFKAGQNPEFSNSGCATEGHNFCVRGYPTAGVWGKERSVTRALSPLKWSRVGWCTECNTCEDDHIERSVHVDRQVTMHVTTDPLPPPLPGGRGRVTSYV